MDFVGKIARKESRVGIVVLGYVDAEKVALRNEGKSYIKHSWKLVRAYWPIP